MRSQNGKPIRTLSGDLPAEMACWDRDCPRRSLTGKDQHMIFKRSCITLVLQQGAAWIQLCVLRL